MSIKIRTCLKCNKRFMSAGPENRICRRCSALNRQLTPMSEAQMRLQRGVKRHNGEIIS